MSPDDFRRRGREIIDFIADYWTRAESFPVLAPTRPGDLFNALPPAAPEQHEPWESMLADVDRLILPNLTHWQSPNFFGYFPANSSLVAVLGDLLSTGLGVQGMLWQTSPACTELETRVLDWLARALGLPAKFLSTGPGGGVIQGTASEATLAALLAAKTRIPADNRGKLVAYASTQSHSSVIKAMMIAGLADSPDDRRCLRLIDTDPNYAMDPAALARAMDADAAAGLRPFFVVATLGTTSTTAMDPLASIGAAAVRHNTWLHVDAAFSGAAFICPEFRGPLKGIEHADSFCMNPHKWLLTTFDCDAFWVTDRAALTRALSVTPEYLRNAASSSGSVIDYRDWQIPLGRRFRALKLWFVLRHYGLAGLRAHIRESVRLGELFESFVHADPRFELCAPRTTSLVCFRLRGTDEPNRRLLNTLNTSGRLFLTHTVLPPTARWPGNYTLRMAVGGSQTREEHVRAAWAAIARAADEVCSSR